MDTEKQAPRFVYMTASTRQEALGLARALVEERLVACVNILGGITSVYWWEGVCQEGEEVALIAKTIAANVPAVIERVRALHSYSCPCVVALAVTEGNPDFLTWIQEQTTRAEGF